MRMHMVLSAIRKKKPTKSNRYSDQLQSVMGHLAVRQGERPTWLHGFY